MQIFPSAPLAVPVPIARNSPHSPANEIYTKKLAVRPFLEMSYSVFLSIH